MKKLFATACCLLFVLPIFVSALGVQDIIKKAGVSIPFGGRSNVVVPCTCSGGVWIEFTPFFAGSLPIGVGALTYRPPPFGKSKPYSYFTAGLPFVWYLGRFNPTPNTCWVGVPPYCVLLPDYGVIDFVGTGMPGAIPGIK